MPLLCGRLYPARDHFRSVMLKESQHFREKEKELVTMKEWTKTSCVRCHEEVVILQATQKDHLTDPRYDTNRLCMTCTSEGYILDQCEHCGAPVPVLKGAIHVEPLFCGLCDPFEE